MSRASSWRQYPSHPSNLGLGGILSGWHNGVVIAAGGTNFPERPPWEGGRKQTYSEIHVLIPGGSGWHPAGELPEPRGYAATVSTSRGVLAIGGENFGRVFIDSMWLQWDGHRIVAKLGPPLPFASTCACAVVLGRYVYAAAGYSAGAPRLTREGFWRLDLDDSTAGWTELPVWPGPSRGQAVMAAIGDAVYLLSGVELTLMPDGTPRSTYLTDAYRYRPGDGWEKLPDMPRSSVAAPSPAPCTLTPERIFLLGGVDGRVVGRQPRDTRVPDNILYFDVSANEWRTWPELWPDPVVTSPAVQTGEDWVFVSGEIMAGVRTPHVWAWRPVDLPADRVHAE